MKWRNSKERELLSAGGTRESTLPTKNNPNPDLSDVITNPNGQREKPNSTECAADTTNAHSDGLELFMTPTERKYMSDDESNRESDVEDNEEIKVV